MKTESDLEQIAWQALEASIIYYQGRRVGTVAACDRKNIPWSYH